MDLLYHCTPLPRATWLILGPSHAGIPGKQRILQAIRSKTSPSTFCENRRFNLGKLNLTSRRIFRAASRTRVQPLRPGSAAQDPVPGGINAASLAHPGKVCLTGDGRAKSGLRI